MTDLHGGHWWAGRAQAGRGAAFRAVAAATGAALGPDYRDATADEVDRAGAAVAAAATEFAACPPRQRADLLRRIADQLLAAGDELLARAHAETALPTTRLVGERARTVLQLRLFADLVEEGSWVDARIDRAEPQRTPLPAPDLRAMLLPLGPVAVFGASNFPFAYSVAGGDTASALAAGCPVLVKAHPAHPGTSELVARAIAAAIAGSGVPADAFAMVHGRSHDVGAAVARHPGIAAVGFTGSVQGGRALWQLAATRPVPIPVFAEMGSVNPVFVLPQALAQRGVQIATAVATSAMQATGQFCTSPGMVLVVDGADGQRFVDELQQRLGTVDPGPLVHPSIRDHFERAVAEVRALPGVSVCVGNAAAAAGPGALASPQLFVAEIEAVLAQGRLREEIYGPALLVVRCHSVDDMLAVARALHGHLTATVHGSDADLLQCGALLGELRRKVGRLVHDGVPTGVEVKAAMQHGGPWPASSDSRFTAVGPRAILRWARPVCFQDAPPATLPEALREGNPLGIWRTVGGVLGRT